jgi:hypothetical protein
MRPMVNGNAPPPWAKATRNFGNRSKTPPKIIEQIARHVSAGMPTSQGSQYLSIRSLPIMSHGWTKTAVFNCSAVFQTMSSDR